MSSPSKLIGELSASRTRPRKDTQALLPSDYAAHPNVAPNAPEPRENLREYTDRRLQQGLAFAHTILSNRTITPRTEAFFTFYKDALKDALNADDQDREKHVLEVKVVEKLIQRNDFLRSPLSTEEVALRDNLLELRQVQYYSRYGDYINIYPTRIRGYASENKTEFWQAISGQQYWTEIAQVLIQEEEAMHKAFKAPGPLKRVERKTHIAVKEACEQLGMREDRALWSIKEYARRNEYAHGNLATMIAQGKFPQLAQTLLADKNDIDASFSDLKNEVDKTHLRAILQELIEEYFDISLDPADPDVWRQTDALRDAYTKAKAQNDKPTAAERKEASTARDARRSEDKAERGKKRLASTEVPRGAEEEASKQFEQKAETNRLELLARRYQLEKDLEDVNRGLAIQLSKAAGTGESSEVVEGGQAD